MQLPAFRKPTQPRGDATPHSQADASGSLEPEQLWALVGVLLATVLGATTWAARRLDFNREDEIAIVFCGSKKSLATGVPMAKILFAGNPALGLIVLPLMVFHQLQLMVCAWLAQRYAQRQRDSTDVFEQHAARTQ